MNERSNTLHDRIEKENICQITALHNGRVAYEDVWHGFTPKDAQQVMSVTKSVVSLLIGIAIDRGVIRGVEQKVLDFFPEYTPKRGEKTLQQVALRELLTMTAPYKYRSEPWTRVCTSDDWTRAALDLLGGKAGLTGTFRYATLGVQILTGVLTRACGQLPVDFANQALFAPLGICPHRSAAARTQQEHYDFLMSKAPREEVWLADPQGVNTAGWGLCLSAREMAAIGQLCLQRGVYEGRRIVSAEWIDALSAPRVACDERYANMSYGYLWWRMDPRASAYAAIGDGGNVIYVDPEGGNVVAVTATFKPRVYDRVQLIQQHIVPLLAD